MPRRKCVHKDLGRMPHAGACENCKQKKREQKTSYLAPEPCKKATTVRPNGSASQGRARQLIGSARQSCADVNAYLKLREKPLQDSAADLPRSASSCTQLLRTSKNHCQATRRSEQFLAAAERLAAQATTNASVQGAQRLGSQDMPCCPLRNAPAVVPACSSQWERRPECAEKR